MKHIICSKIYSDINIRIPTKQIVNCCKRIQYTQPSLEEIKELKTGIFHNRPENLNDKEYILKNNSLSDACRYCKANWPNSIWNTWNVWKDKDWTNDELDLLSNKDHTKYIEIMLGTTCNMSCIYCSEDSSSVWADLKNIPRQSNNIEWQNAVLENLYEFIKNNDHSHLTYSFLGGEPLLQWELFDILENILSIHREKIRLAILSLLPLILTLNQNY